MKKLFLTIFITGMILMSAKETTETILSPDNHHYLGIEMNIQTWNLLTKQNRTKQDDVRLVNFAKASQYHWYKSPKWQPVNAQRGEWLISHVYAVLGLGEKALVHAKSCLKMTKEQDLKDFDLAYAYESLARAQAALGNKQEGVKYYKLAKEAGEAIKDSADKKYFDGDFAAEPWYGLRKK